MQHNTHTSILFSLLLLAASTVYADTDKYMTTEEDRVDLSVTAYNNNIALVRDRRMVQLPSGRQELAFMDVAQKINPVTVQLRSHDTPVSILEQNYEYDLMSPAKMLEKYIGKSVTLVNFDKNLGFQEVEAELLSLNGGSIYRVGDKIHLNHPGSVVLPEIPANLIAKPSLIWLLDIAATDKPSHELEVSYITGGIRWAADYVLILDRNNNGFDLDGWVTLNNQSGTTYDNAKIKLVAGEVHRASKQHAYPEVAHMRAAAMADAGGMHEEQLADYHLYSLPERTTLKENQSKQVRLLSRNGMPCEKVYELHSRNNVWYHRSAGGRNSDLHRADVFLKFDNKQVNPGLEGAPLPAGVMRVYQEDSEGMLQFIGEDRVDHTPEEETVRLKLGKAFDVVAETRQTDFTKHGKNYYCSSYETKIRNHQDHDVVVQVVESVGSNWQITKKSHEFIKRDAFTIVFPVTVPANGEAVLTYTIEVRN